MFIDREQVLIYKKNQIQASPGRLSEPHFFTKRIVHLSLNEGVLNSYNTKQNSGRSGNDHENMDEMHDVCLAVIGCPVCGSDGI